MKKLEDIPEKISVKDMKELVKQDKARLFSQFSRFPYVKNGFAIYQKRVYFRISEDEFELIYWR